MSAYSPTKNRFLNSKCQPFEELMYRRSQRFNPLVNAAHDFIRFIIYLLSF